jgi:hypothetical protein
MKIRSRGLGRRELKMDLHEFKVTKEGHEVVVSGVTHAPVTWETVIRIAPEDIGGMLRVALNPKFMALGIRWALHLPSPSTESPPPAWERRSTGATLRSYAMKDEKDDGSEAHPTAPQASSQTTASVEEDDKSGAYEEA